MCAGWTRGSHRQDAEPDVPRDLRTVGDWANVIGGDPSRDQEKLSRVGPDLSTPGRLWGRGRAEPGSKKPELADAAAYFGSSLSLQFFCPLIQFVCVESLVTALVDMYPRVFRKKNRRELLILGVSVTSFLVGLVMLTEVRVREA